MDSWTDAVGGVVVSNTGSLRPTYHTALIGGRGALDFSGSQYLQWLTTNGAYRDGSTAYAIYIVLQPDTFAAGGSAAYGEGRQSSGATPQG